MQLRCTIPCAIGKVQNICDEMLLAENLDDSEKLTLTSRCREILLQGFRFGFEVLLLSTKINDKITIVYKIFLVSQGNVGFGAATGAKKIILEYGPIRSLMDEVHARKVRKRAWQAAALGESGIRIFTNSM